MSGIDGSTQSNDVVVGSMMDVQRFPESDVAPDAKEFVLPKDGKTWTAYSNGNRDIVKWIGNKLYGLWTLNRDDVCNTVVPLSYYEAERVITQPTYVGYCQTGTQAPIVSMTVGGP